MKLSQKADYALRAMFDLAQQADKGEAVRTSDIAKREDIPEKFLELILVELRKAGLVRSQRGSVGGHRLAKAAEQITVGDVWRVIDGPLLPEAEIKRGRGAVSLGAACMRPVWKEVEKSVRDVVDYTTLADLLKNAAARRGVLDYNI
ncbi:MAG: Rrf2 family transcriptional regulator [Planctomycetes bacterium]|nr:Rrf2 family transcriptional regulator [Planctomycetota bacterium]